MANMADCIARAAAAGEVDAERAAEAQTRYAQLVDRYRTIMPEHAAQAAAAKDMREATKAATAAKAHKTVTQLQAMRRIRDLIEGADDPAVAIRQLLEHSEGSGFAGESVRSLADALVRSVNAQIAEFLAETGQTMIGTSRNPALLRDVLRELHGEASGSPRAKALAEAVGRAQERMRQSFNAHGGDIGKLDDYGVHHTHEVSRLRRAGYETWAREIAPRLDWSRMTDRATGKPFVADKGALPDPDVRDRFLRAVYDNITTGGWARREPSLAVGGKALYNRRAEPRQLHFKSGSDWLDYNAKYGAADPFSSLIGGLHGMARDVALMRVLGPNPQLGLEYAVQVARKKAAGNARMENRVETWAGVTRAMLAHQSGAANTPAISGWAAFFAGTRQVLTSIQLGAALLSSPGDLATISAASRMVGMNPGNVLSRSVRLMSSRATRETARRMGYVADTLADAGSAAARYTGDVWSPQITQTLSNFTIRASGLSFWTDMNRTAFQMEFAGYLAENAGRGWDDIDAPLRRVLEARGIGAADWDALRVPEARFRAENGADFITPFHWLETQTRLPREEAEGLAMRLQMAIEEQMELAVPSNSLEGRAWTLGETRPGTPIGEIARSFTMYKSFSLSLTLGQIRRTASIPTPLGRWRYAAGLGAGLVVLGALSVQLKELAKGRDPRPMTDGAFWAAAIFQGGGLGIFGDFFASETSRAGGGIAETIAGPVAGAAGDVIGIGASAFQRGLEGDDQLIGRDVANMVRYNTPVLSSLWYSRLAYDRFVADSLQELLDPDAAALWRRQQRRAFTDYGTQQWWPNGAPAPDRAPDLTNAARTR